MKVRVGAGKVAVYVSEKDVEWDQFFEGGSEDYSYIGCSTAIVAGVSEAATRYGLKVGQTVCLPSETELSLPLTPQGLHVLPVQEVLLILEEEVS
jgi:hypothetical protein